MAHPREFAEGLSIGIIMDGNGRWAKNRLKDMFRRTMDALLQEERAMSDC